MNIKLAQNLDESYQNMFFAERIQDLTIKPQKKVKKGGKTTTA